MILPWSYRYARALLSFVVIAGFTAGGYLAWRDGFTDGAVAVGRSVAASVVYFWRSI